MRMIRVITFNLFISFSNISKLISESTSLISIFTLDNLFKYKLFKIRKYATNLINVIKTFNRIKQNIGVLIIFSKHLHNSLFLNSNNLRNPIVKDCNCDASFSMSENIDISTFKCFRLNKINTFLMNEMIKFLHNSVFIIFLWTAKLRLGNI